MSKGHYEDRIPLLSKFSTSKMNPDCNNLNEKGMKSTTMTSSNMTTILVTMGKHIHLRLPLPRWSVIAIIKIKIYLLL